MHRNIVVSSLESVLLSTVAVISLAAFTSPARAAISYSQDFNSLGATGTSLAGIPEWEVYRYLTGTLAGTWTTSIRAAEVGGGTLMDNVTGQQALGLFYNPDFPTFTRVGGINAGLSLDSGETNRALGTSPSGFAGNALQLSISNTTGAEVSALEISYDTIVLAAASGNELAGYRVFYSLTGVNGTWTGVPALDTVTASSDPAFTTYTTSGTLNLGTPLADGQSILLRWVDDNATQTSPDQMIAIDDVTVASPIPEAGTVLFGVALCLAIGMRRHRS